MIRLTILFLIFIPLISWSQDKGLPVNLSLFNQSTAIPYTRLITTPVHPGFQMGIEFNEKFKKQRRLYQAANVFYFYHKHVTQAFGLNTEIGYEQRFAHGIALSGLAGLGYMHSFATADEFKLKNGRYTRKKDKGNSRIIPSLSLDLGFYPGKIKTNTKIFFRYQAWLEYPYSPGFISVMPHLNVHLGIKFNSCKKPMKND